MMARSTFGRARALAAAALAAAGAVAGCAQDPELVLAPEPRGGADFMARYVAIGNSITAGYQSGGIGAATQSAAFPAIVARAAGVDYTAPLLAGPGCAPLTDALSAFRAAIGDPTLTRPSSVCARVGGGEFLNNVAVPGANSSNVTNQPGFAGNPLTTLILGGRTQIERAVEYGATFVSVWIGNNDVLGAALQGDTTRATPVATFQANYDALIAGLAATPAVQNRRGILIGVVDVTNVPAVFPAAVIVNDLGGFRTAFEQGFLRNGRTLAIHPNCAPNTTALVSLALLLQTANAAQSLPANSPVPFACAPATVAPGVTIGTGGILEPAETAALSARVAAYNAYIQQKAAQLGWAFFNPNATLARLKATPGMINPAPNLTAAAPFGAAISLDGIHPSSVAHVEVAADLVSAINREYGTSIPDPRSASVATR